MATPSPPIASTSTSPSLSPSAPCTAQEIIKAASIPLPPVDDAELEVEAEADQLPEPAKLDLLAFPDDILLCIARFLHIQYNPGFKPKHLSSLRLTCRHLSLLLRPLFWSYVWVPDDITARLVLRIWIHYPETRSLTRELWSYGLGSSDLFTPTALSFDLGLKRLQIDGLGGLVPSWFTEEVLKFGKDLKELTVGGYENGWEDKKFRLAGKFKELRLLEVAGLTVEPEVYFGLEKLDTLEVRLHAPMSEEDEIGGSGNGKGKTNPVEKTLEVVEHYVPQIESLSISWGGCSCCPALVVTKELTAVFEKKYESSTFAPLMNEFFLSNFQLFSQTSTFLLPILRALSTSPKLRRLYLYAFGLFIPPDDYESIWSEIRLPQVTNLYLAGYNGNPGMGHKGILTDVTLRPLLHFLRIFPSLRSLFIPDAFDYTPSSLAPLPSPTNSLDPPIGDEPSVPPLEAAFIASSAEERALRHPALMVLTKMLLKSQLCSLRVGAIWFYRRNKEVKEWEVEVVHKIL